MGNSGSSALFEVLVVFVLVFAVQVVLAVTDLVRMLFVLAAPLSENPWTIVTSVYAHAGVDHLLSNAVALVLFGWPVARATSRVRFHAFFLVAGSFAGVAQVLASNALAGFPIVGASPTAGVVGASGAVFALLGYLLASNRLSSSIGAAFSLPPWVTYAAFVFVATLVTLATAQPGVALIAHFVGLLFGLVAGRLNVLSVSRKPSKRR